MAAAGLYFDGATSARHDVSVEAAAQGLRVLARDGALLAEWRYDELRAMSASDDVMRLGRASGPELARIEFRDPALIAEVGRRAEWLDRKGPSERRMRKRVIGWSVAAVASLVLMAVYGLPALAGQIAPLIPLSIEHRLGQAMDAQMRDLLAGGKTDKPLECGTADSEQAGRAALTALTGRLEAGAGLPIPLRAIVVRRKEANAIALPGGHVYVFEGLIDKARSPDELAGVIAHEIGHVAHRDGTRSLLQAAGLSFLFGVLLGDFTGGGLVVIAARTVMQSAYTRKVEAAADLYAVELVSRIGGDPRAFAAILDRIAGAVEPADAILSDHPQTRNRVATILAAASAHAGTPRPLLAEPEWAALKRICR